MRREFFRMSYVKVPKRLTLPQQMAGTLLCLLVYRLLSCVPLPFMNTAMIEILMGAGGSMGLLNVLTGGNLSRMSIAALGVSPYITASIFVQLFGIIIPPVAAMQRDGAVGRKKIKRLTVALSGIFAVLTASGMMYGYWQAGLLTVGVWYGAVIPGVLMVAASLLVTWMGQLIDDKFFGNGVSLLLLADRQVCLDCISGCRCGCFCRRSFCVVYVRVFHAAKRAGISGVLYDEDLRGTASEGRQRAVFEIAFQQCDAGHFCFVCFGCSCGGTGDCRP